MTSSIVGPLVTDLYLSLGWNPKFKQIIPIKKLQILALGLYVCIIYSNVMLYYIYRNDVVPRSVVDLLIHLTGREVPRLPYSLSISDDLSLRTTQLIQQYTAILDFLR